jgi:hypothetical protein
MENAGFILILKACLNYDLSILEEFVKYTLAYFCILEVYLKYSGYWKHTGSILENTGRIMEAYWKHTGSILEAYWKHTGSVLETYWKHTGSILEAY